MMKKNAKIIRRIFSWVILSLLLLFAKGVVYGDELLKTLFMEKKWDQLAANFLDNSYKTLKNYFSTSKSVKIITLQANQMTYKAKYPLQGEIGVITFDKKEDKYFNLKIRNQIRPLYFIESFKMYRASNIRITVGDARIHFIEGVFYETQPFHSLLLFKGKWTFSIKPSDREERLTLKRRYKKDRFSRTLKSGIFILAESEFLKQLPAAGESQITDDETQELYTMYRDSYGIHIPQYNEYWYLPFPQETHLIIFKRDKKSFYYYSYNRNLVPDTRLSISGSNLMILSYNAGKGMKLSFGAVETVEHVNLSLFFNPENQYISGTSTISYKSPSSLRILQLDPQLKLAGSLSLSSKGTNVFRKRNKYYLMGPESKSLSLYYNGRFKPEQEQFEIFRSQPAPRDSDRRRDEDEDLFYFFSKTDDFYPNPGNKFFNSDVTVALPTGLNCLVSGNLVQKMVGDTTTFRFSCNKTKGISMAVGEFKLAKKLNSRPPIHFYTLKSLRFPRNLNLEEIEQGADLFSRTFGHLDLPIINILLKEGHKEGGISNPGFIVVNLPEARPPTPIIQLPSSASSKVLTSPVLFRNRSEDHILHELAHQWWGGVISWKSYHDIWLTEGLAHFSVLYYLKKKLDNKKFMRMVKKIKRWVMKSSDSGPIIYGSRINMLENDYEAFQSVIYNKSTLLFLMLLDLTGEKEFTRRMQKVLKKSKYRSLNSMTFIRQFSGKNKMLLNFFKRWIYSRDLPLVQLKLDPEDKEYDSKTFKKIVITIEQLDTDKDRDTNSEPPFVFPLKLKVVTMKGTSVEPVIIKKKKHRFVIDRDATIRSIDIMDDIVPLREKKSPNPAFFRK
jgi:hypothetical protein